MSDRPKLLRRAVGVVGSNGQPVSDELIFAPKAGLRKHSLSLSASIRRKFTKLVRSRSVGAVDFFASAVRPLPAHSLSADEPLASRAGTPTTADVVVPSALQAGTSLTKVTNKKHKKVVFSLDADQGQIVWEGKVHRFIPIEAIKEIRSGQDARYYRQQFHLSPEYEERWLTIIYILDGNYKTLHVVAPTRDVFHMWNTTLRRLHAIRQELMKGLGNVEMRQAMWEKHYWKNADEESDQKLVFEEVSKMCRRLNISSGEEDLYRLFKQADTLNRDYLDFPAFRVFVKLLKSRPEVDRLFKKHRSADGFDFVAFERFMRDKQKSTLSRPELQAVFEKYATTTPSTPPLNGSPDKPVPAMTWESFTAFLMSSDNPAISALDRTVHHDMNRPLSEYYISSSHNTYLVGHQLVGSSTIEGYIRALLHSCRSVEVDIYDGEEEPMIFHGKTFTSKVSFREVCEAIHKYGFVASPYPIIISAEIHCGLEQQDKVAEIMIEVFGDALIQRTEDMPVEIRYLPSPEELKGKVMLKTKNVYISSSRETSDELVCDVSASSTSESEEDWRKSPSRRQSDSIRQEFQRAKSVVIQRVRSRSRGKSSAPPPPPSAPSTPSKPSTHKRSSSVTFGTPPSSPRFPPSAGSGRHSSTPPSHTLSSNSHPTSPDAPKPKPKMSPALLSLLVYTVGVKCRGLNKKEAYAPSHMFSLSENTLNKMIRGGAGGGGGGRGGMADVIKHTRDHLVRTYPKGLRVGSSNYEPHRYWSAGCQLVAMNWQTFDLGYMINQAMFQRNGRSGYVLKPLALRASPKDLLSRPTNKDSLAPSPKDLLALSLSPKDLLTRTTRHFFDIRIISAQQLPRPKDASGREIVEKGTVDPYVEICVHVPDWTQGGEGEEGSSSASSSSGSNGGGGGGLNRNRSSSGGGGASLNRHTNTNTPLARTHSTTGTGTPPTTAKTYTYRTSVVKNNGFNPIWEEDFRIPFECVGGAGMRDLIFVRFVVRGRGGGDADEEPLAVFCASLGALQEGYRHLPLHDGQMSMFLFSTLFVRVGVVDC